MGTSIQNRHGTLGKTYSAVYTRILFPEDPDERQEIMEPWATLTPPPLMLLWKGKALEGASDFRPICLLNMPAKVFERLISERLSANQYGFRRNKSIVLAVSKIVDGVRGASEK
ncbi:hypothetical protein JTB14_023500 [Gonioctena quinquepunctata]|nr:hypothetical protein JTB14_023500 [Gonioctena quinquepunctata]